MAEHERVEWLDVCKGLGMMLVIIGHVMTTSVREAWQIGMNMYIFIYLFHMPLMFYLAGRAYGLSHEHYIKLSEKKFIVKKAKSLMLPYVCYNLLVYAVFFLANMTMLSGVLSASGYGKISVKDFLWKMFIGDNSYAFHLWYIYALFIMYAVTFLIQRIAEKIMINDNVVIGILIVIAMFLAATRYYVITSTWGVINEIMQFYMWFLIGIKLDLSRYIKKAYVMVFEVISLVAAVIFAMYQNELFEIVGYRICSLLSWIVMLGMIFIFITFAVVIRGTVRKFFNYTGINSYGIYIFHQPFFGSGVGLVLMKVVGAPVIPSVIIAVVLCYIVPILIIKMLHTRVFSFLAPFFIGSRTKVSHEEKESI